MWHLREKCVPVAQTLSNPHCCIHSLLPFFRPSLLLVAWCFPLRSPGSAESLMWHCPALFAFFLKIHVYFLLGSKHLGAAHISDMAPIPVLKSQHLQPLNFLQSLMLPGTSIQPVRQSPLLQSRQNSQSQLNYKKRQSSDWSLLRTSVAEAPSSAGEWACGPRLCLHMGSQAGLLCASVSSFAKTWCS